MGQLWINNVAVEGYAEVIPTPHDQKQIVGEFSLRRGEAGSETVEQAMSELARVEFRGDLEIEGILYYAVCSVELFSVVVSSFLSGKFRSYEDPLVLKRIG